MKELIFVFLLGLFIGLLLEVPRTVRAQEKMINSSSDAILYLKALDTNEEKIKYLLYQGQKFMEEEKYKDAREIAEYILNDLNLSSVEAKDLLDMAKKKEEASKMPQLNPVTIPLGK